MCLVFTSLCHANIAKVREIAIVREIASFSEVAQMCEVATPDTYLSKVQSTKGALLSKGTAIVISRNQLPEDKMLHQPDPEKLQAETVTTHQETIDGVNSLAYHEETPKTPEEAKTERKFVRKIDFIILPLLAGMYFLASLDRGDIGNASVAGMSKDLGLSPQMFSNCSAMFFVGYIVFQLPGDLFLRVVTPPVQLALALMVWGLFTALLSQAKSYAAVVGLRVCIGVGEAFLQAGPLYLTFWYKRNELATRGSIFFSMSAIAGAFNGIIAYGITKNLNGTRGLPAWRWLFLIEGVISVAYGFVVLFLLPPVPEKLKRGFSAEQREIAVRRSKEAFNTLDAKIDLKQLLKLLKDPKSYFLMAIYCCLSVSLASFSTFLPVILKSFGYSALKTQAMTIPVYLCIAVYTVAISITSDRLKRRGLFLILSFGIAAAGWLVLIVSKSGKLSYAGTFFVGIGSYPTVVLTQAWANSNIIGFTKRAGILGLINIFGQCFSIAGAEIYSDPPHYYRGNGFSLGAVVIGAVLAGGLMFYLSKQNDRKVRNQNTDEARILRLSSIEEIGDAHPDFMFYM